jgi:DNA-binding MarR family transcriptional regulator
MRRNSKIATVVLPMLWVPPEPTDIGDIEILGGKPGRVEYHGHLEGLTAAIDVLPHGEELRAVPLGHLPLLVGDIPVEERWRLREQQRSFVTFDGDVCLRWPALTADGTIAVADVRSDDAASSIPLQQGHVRLVQTLLAAHVDGKPVASSSQLAKAAGAVPSTVTRLLDKLETAGLVTVERNGRIRRPIVVDGRRLAWLLRARSTFVNADVIDGYVPGQGPEAQASRIADFAKAAGYELAFTGLHAASWHGATSTGAPTLDLWIRGPRGEADAAPWLIGAGIEPLGGERGNVRAAIDRTGAGVVGVDEADYGPAGVPVAHPLRVWADLPRSARAADIADQLWERLHLG